jgi:hypothetical protein
MKCLLNTIKASHLFFWAGLAFIFFFHPAPGQQLIWAKLYSLPKEDQISCITQDSYGDIYAGGLSYQGAVFPGNRTRAMLYKLNPDGDTLYGKWVGVLGSVMAIAEHPSGFMMACIEKRGSSWTDPSQTHIIYMTYEGFIFKRDTISNILYVNHSCVGKDSSWILCGSTRNPINGFIDDFYVQRIRKDGTIEPYYALNDNFSGRAHRVEQLPNGKYLVSGSAGLRLISYTFNENLSNPQPMEIWHQSNPSNPISNGVVSRISGSRYMIGGQSGPCIVGQVDSLKQKYWIKKEVGTQIPPQAMTDGSIVFGYKKGVPPYQVFYRVAMDSSYVWNMPLRDSLVARGLVGNLTLKCFTYFEDQSAVVAGYYSDGNAITQEDPFFIKISNVGTPVTSLSKPKKGSLQNETLAPWPNPSSGTLYLKQHFDKAEVRFYNLSGKEMGQYQIRFGQPIELSALPPGLYLYRAVIDGKSYSGKVVKR